MSGIRRWTGYLGAMLPPFALALIVGALWEFAVWYWGIKPYLLPSPSAILAALSKNALLLLKATAYTGAAALFGFACSLIIGSLIALLFSQSKLVRQSCYPYAIFLQTVPIVAVAQLIVHWCGRGFPSLVLVAFIISLFPILSNTTAGLLSVDPDLIDLFRINHATRWQVLWKLRVPNAIPSLCIAAKTSSGLAVVGAIVGEYFAGYGEGRTGLGRHLLETLETLKMDQAFATVLATTLLALLIFSLSSTAGDRILSHWFEPPAEHRQ